MITTATYKYQVALSFADENRQYVDQVATQLKKLGISIFYNEFEQVELWGKDLYSHLDDVYRNRARFCVMFISKAYQKKNWPNLERKSAQARAFGENKEYILPARFDNTEIPGVLPTVGYIDLRNLTPKQFAEIIIQKLEASILSKTSKATGTESPRKIQTKAKSSKPKEAIEQSTKSGGKAKSRDRSSKTKTVNLNQEGIGKLSNDRPVVYKILTEGGNNNFTGAAKRGEVKAKILEHLSDGKRRVPGSKVFIECMNNFGEAQAKAARIIERSHPKYNN